MILIFGRNAKLPAKWAFLQLTEFTGPLRDPNTASPSQIHAQGHGSISESASASSPLGLKGATSAAVALAPPGAEWARCAPLLELAFGHGQDKAAHVLDRACTHGESEV